jgi:hypothetical protein
MLEQYLLEQYLLEHYLLEQYLLEQKYCCLQKALKIEANTLRAPNQIQLLVKQ